MNAARSVSADLKAARIRFQLPDYTKGEEIANMVTHIVGAAFAVAVIPLLVIMGASHHSAWSIVSGVVYGISLLAVYVVSSVYHGLKPSLGKKVMRIIDHCDIYFLIAGTYTPILLCSVRQVNPALAWTIFGVEWALAAMAVTLNAIDLKRFEKVSMVCYIGMGWCVVACVQATIEAMSMDGFMLLLYGGISYTVGAVLYGIGKRVRYMHSVFHLFVFIGSVLQFLSIFFYVI